MRRGNEKRDCRCERIDTKESRTCNVKASSSLQKLVLISRNARCNKDPNGEFDTTLPLFPLLRGTAT